MTKQEKYRLEVRKIANEILNSKFPEATYSKVVMEDITARAEKIHINKFIPNLELQIKNMKSIGHNPILEEKILQILKSRLEVL